MTWNFQVKILYLSIINKVTMKNKQITAVEDGEKYWVSQRAVGCGIFLFRKSDTGIEVCIIKRKGIVEELGGRWCCPCGYLDADETGEECASRELREETGIYIAPEAMSLVNVSTSPKEYGQHVCLEYAHLMTEADFIFNPEFAPTDKDEIDTVMWVNIRELGKYKLCFNHTEKCMKIIQKLLFHGIQSGLIK